MQYPKIKTKISIVAIFVASFIFLFLSMNRAISVYDEGIVLTAAMRVTAGDIPHRDFYANYGPAEFYLLSWLFDLFGQRIIVERLFDLVVRAGIVTLVYASLTLYCRQLVVIFITVICTLWLCTVGNHGYPVYPALLFSIGSSLMLLKALTPQHMNSIMYPVIAGTLTGLSALFRYDIGFFAFVAHCVAVFVLIFHSKSTHNNSAPNISHSLLPYILASSIPVAAVLIWYASNGAFNAFIHDIILYPGEYYARTRSLPFPDLSTIFYSRLGAIYLPVLIICAVLLNFFRKDDRPLSPLENRANSETFPRNNSIECLIIFTLLTSMFYIKGWVRVSVEHMQLALIPSMVILALLMDRAQSHAKWFKIVVKVLVLITCVTTLSAVLSYKSNPYNLNLVLYDLNDFYNKLSLNNNTFKADLNPSTLPDITKVTGAFSAGQDRDDAARFISQNTAPNERTFIGLTRHDKVFANDVSSYFQTNRLPATKWHHFDPGLQPRADIQSAMITDLDQYKPNFIWLESTWDEVSEPNESAKNSGITIFDEYIRGQYIKVRNFGLISVWQRRAK